MKNTNDKIISWGIIGCGDVTEVKSGPAFNKVKNSRLVAVMRRDLAKAADYAKRHGVATWYDNAAALINNSDINAIYIATPPKFHEEYAIQAMQAGKYVYVEKPVAIDIASCKRMIDHKTTLKSSITVAHYRRALPKFLAIKKMIEENKIGKVKLIQLNMMQPHQSSLIASSEKNWRVDPAIAGGGLFFDLAPHQLDIITFIFGNYICCSGMSLNTAKYYEAEDTVVGYAQLPNDIVFSGTWCFTAPANMEEDNCTIIGEKGSCSFPFFGDELEVTTNEGKQNFSFEKPAHIQEPMINKVVQYFLGNEPNPCSLEEALISLEIMERFKLGNPSANL
ncbi:MAG TPA: Gfo/Idh/MocA family oxidoreductase [Ferruginibacter sp.]|jgi:predicted dehydrogenase|nr:Gfo/Idh/MocA family oxidoreductase [Ferruginibacter sp.]